jgi:hypothetical protein
MARSTNIGWTWEKSLARERRRTNRLIIEDETGRWWKTPAGQGGMYMGYRIRLRNKVNGNVSIFIDRHRLHIEGSSLLDAAQKAKKYVQDLERNK